MSIKPTYEELEQKVKELENKAGECRQAQETLWQSEERLKTILDYIQAGIVIIRNLQTDN
ncbi:MAG: hypothetical protein JRF08_00145 [Deltaproteobacteria bacterium]|nr:hypothetical protein [Deltaproteobacteria bacterium]MBW2106187.1 hypothetical protein [Deltaproteobacteria bacterium]MBW2331906.1 hypothetical protein [Deltaproteobacteria bacterium]